MIDAHTLIAVSLVLILFGLVILCFGLGCLFCDSMYRYHASKKTAVKIEQIREGHEQRKRQVMMEVNNLTEEAIRKMVNAAEEQKRKRRTTPVNGQ